MCLCGTPFLDITDRICWERGVACGLIVILCIVCGVADVLAGRLLEFREELTSTRPTRLLGQGCRAIVNSGQWSSLSNSQFGLTSSV